MKRTSGNSLLVMEITKILSTQN